jgi:parvulin-like peptidyl-prolyl isomerase
MIGNRAPSHPAPALALALAAAWCLALAPAAAAPARAATAPAAPADTLLATFAGGEITPTEFARAWRILQPDQRPEGDPVRSRRTFLQRMVERELIAREASALPFTPTPEQQAELDRTRAQLIQNELFAEMTGGVGKPTAQDLEVFRRQRAELAEVRFVSFPSWDMARSWRLRLTTGTPLSALDEVLRRGGPEAPQADSFRFVAAEEIPDTLAGIIWAMRPGQVSEIHSFANHPVLIQLRAYAPHPVRVRPDDDLAIEERWRRRKLGLAREAIRHDLAKRVGREFVDDGMNVLLQGYLRLPPRTDVDSLTGMPTVRVNIPLPAFAPADTGRIIARTRDREFNLMSYLRYWGRIPMFALPEVRERLVLEGAVDRMILEEELIRMGLERGLDRKPSVVAELARQREGFALDHWFATRIASQVEVNEAALRRFFESRPRGHYDDPATLEGRIILVDRRELADSLLALARGGADFGSLARTHSLDGRTGAQGGDIGVMQRGSNPNAGLEDAMFATTPGRFGGPEQTPEGWVIWRVDRQIPGKVRTLAEAREWVERDFRVIEGERILEAHLAELRKKANARIYEERVTAELGTGGMWD